MSELSPRLPELGPGAENAPEPTVLKRFAAAAWPYALVIAVGLFVLLPALGDYGFWDPWEPKYAESAREMRDRGSYIVPYYRGEVRLTKPILAYWGILAGSAVFGLNEFGARIAGVALAILSTCVAYYAVSTLRGRKAGIFAAVVLTTIPQFYFIGRQATPDVYLFTTLGCSLLLFALGLYGPASRRTLHFVLSYLGFALAILAKGPIVSGAIFFTTLAVHTLVVADLRLLVRPGVRWPFVRFLVLSALGLLLFVVSALITYLFGTSSLWWGYAAPQRLAVGDGRRALLGALNGIHGQEILLVAFACGFLAIAARSWFTRGSGGPLRLVGMGAALAAALLACSGLAFGDENRVLIVGIVGCTAGLALVVAASVRLLRVPDVRAGMQPWVAPITRQVLLFAVVILVVAGPWHVAIVLDQAEGYVTDFIVKHNFARAIDEVNSTGVSDFYLRALVWGYFPWAAFIPIMLAGLIAWTDREVLRRQGFEIYLLIAAFSIFVIFTFPVTKFTHYLAPLLAPMAVLVGITLARMTERSSPWSRLGWFAAAMLFVLQALDLLREGGVRYLVSTFTVKRWVPEELEPGSYVAALLGVGALLLLFNVFLRSTLLAGAFLAVAVLFAHYQTAVFVPELSRHKSLKGLVESYQRYHESNEPLGFYGDLKHGIFFYSRDEVELCSDSQELMSFMDPQRRRAFTIIERRSYFKIRTMFNERFPGAELYIIDDSHFDYNLIANFPIAGAADHLRSLERGIIGHEED